MQGVLCCYYWILVIWASASWHPLVADVELLSRRTRHHFEFDPHVICSWALQHHNWLLMPSLGPDPGLSWTEDLLLGHICQQEWILEIHAVWAPDLFEIVVLQQLRQLIIIMLQNPKIDLLKQIALWRTGQILVFSYGYSNCFYRFHFNFSIHYQFAN